MRVRLQLLAPFEESKVLLPLSPNISTVSELKKHVRSSLTSVLSLSTSPKDLLLEVDGFELLAGSSVGVIEGSDVVTVRLRAGSSKQELGTRKRSPSGSRDGGGDGKRRRIIDSTVSSSQPPTAHAREASPAPSSTSSEASSSSSSSVSSSSSSASSSSSSASSSSSSSSSDSSSSAGPPSVQNNPPFPVPPAGVRLAATPTQHIPPGQGKPSTQERNQRRKLARQLNKQAELRANGLIGDKEPAHLAADAARVNSMDITTPTQSSLPVPKAMANRNKKKGFLQEMSSRNGTKTVFGDDAQGSSTPFGEQSHAPIIEPSVPVPNADTPSQPARQRERAVPPSEQDLPSNVFVTHVVYQRKGWTPRGRKGAKVPAEGGANGDLNANGVEQTEGEESILEEEQHSVIQPQTEAEPVADSTEGQTDIWTAVESGFDALPLVSRAALPIEGAKIAWKELQLDPYTYSPQLAVQIAEVKAVSSTEISVHRLDRYAEDDDAETGAADTDWGKVIALSELDADASKYRFVQ